MVSHLDDASSLELVFPDSNVLAGGLTGYQRHNRFDKYAPIMTNP